ncbi:hypothetical protein ABPG77_001771 [Micractinium sp. CCAP 211/92]
MPICCVPSSRLPYVCFPGWVLCLASAPKMCSALSVHCTHPIASGCPDACATINTCQHPSASTLHCPSHKNLLLASWVAVLHHAAALLAPGAQPHSACGGVAGRPAPFDHVHPICA